MAGGYAYRCTFADIPTLALEGNRMSTEDSYYGKVMAQYYDLLYESFDSDIPFYVEESINSGGPVLELGCGTGRVSIPIAQAGIAVTGLDLSESMLAIARKKTAGLPEEVGRRLSFRQGNMEDFSLNTEFSLVIIPFRAFLHLLTPESQRGALSTIRNHLKKKGKLIISVFDPRITAIAAHLGANENTVQKLKESDIAGGKLIVWETRSYDPLNQIVHCGRIFEEVDGDGLSQKRLHTSFDLRYNFRFEMLYLFELCGYRLCELYGDFSRGPIRHGNEQIWIVERID